LDVLDADEWITGDDGWNHRGKGIDERLLIRIERVIVHKTDNF